MLSYAKKPTPTDAVDTCVKDTQQWQSSQQCNVKRKQFYVWTTLYASAGRETDIHIHSSIHGSKQKGNQWAFYIVSKLIKR